MGADQIDETERILPSGEGRVAKESIFTIGVITVTHNHHAAVLIF
jgi:hypothetical protein